MAVKKSELYSSLWKSCDELRGSMDASQYKDYVLVLLFIKYVSDKYADDPYALIDVPAGGSFKDMSALKNDKEIGDKINKIIGKLAEANNLKGVIDIADFNEESKLGRGKEMVDRLTNLVTIFENPALDFTSNRAEGDDLLGDAYEYLMRHFATESGKSKGQFYTPSEVSQVMAKVIGIKHATSQSQTIYDPTCGSGSLLLKAANETERGITIYGQEMDNATAALAKMNMILHNNPTADIWQDNTLANPYWIEDGQLKRFDFVVANPPFSAKSWSNGLNPTHDEFERFADGIPPAKNGDYAFLLHIIRSLKSTGKGAVILPHGVLFRGNVEAEIRRNIIRKGYIKGIIGLPPNLFYGTGIPACIIVLDKENAASRRGIFMVDASRGFMKDGNKNRLRHQDIHKIVDVFTNQLPTEKYARLVPYAEIEANDYNLNIPRYIDSTEPEDIQDIEAHLRGGIPQRDIDALQAYWEVFPSLRRELFAADRAGYSQLTVEAAHIKAAIFDHPEFTTYAEQVTAVFNEWVNQVYPQLAGMNADNPPKNLIEDIAESLLQSFDAVRLLNKYDIYQRLMGYWDEVMQDDAYLIVLEGWLDANKLCLLVKDGKRYTEDADFDIGKQKYKADLIPPQLVIARYFAEAQQEIDDLTAQVEDITGQMDSLSEEHGGEDGLLAEAQSDSGKVTKGNLNKRLKELTSGELDPDDQAEYDILTAYQELMDNQAKLTKTSKAAWESLLAQVIEVYPQLTEDEIKTLVIEDKWLTAIEAAIHSELDSISQVLTGRIKELAERYATPLPILVERAAELSTKVDGHLRKMGF